MAVRIVAHAFEIVHLLTDQNPIQCFVDAVVACGPREDSTRIGSQGAWFVGGKKGDGRGLTWTLVAG